MMLTFFVEQYGYYMDQELMVESAGYVRDAFVMARDILVIAIPHTPSTQQTFSLFDIDDPILPGP